QSEDGEPIEAAPVMAFALYINNGHKIWDQAGSARPDEYGEFRIANLTPDTYYLKAGPKLRSSFPNARSATRQLGFAAAYYAGTPARESATAIELVPGQQFESYHRRHKRAIGLAGDKRASGESVRRSCSGPREVESRNWRISSECSCWQLSSQGHYLE